MTGFLCALGGVCLQQRSTPGPATYSPPMGPSAERKQSMISMGPCDMSNPLVSASSFSSSASNETPVSRFLDRLLSLLVCGHDRVGLHIRTNVKDLLGLELSPALYPMLFNKLRNSIGRFFDTQGPVCRAVTFVLELGKRVPQQLASRQEAGCVFCPEIFSCSCVCRFPLMTPTLSLWSRR